MQISRVYVRFYKSFNFDYERRAKANAQRHEWEMIGEGWYPHVRIDIDSDVTAVVGSNESGKSHLLHAIECVTGVRELSRSDFCRYSQLYSVETGAVRLPDVGAVFKVDDPEEVAQLATLGIKVSEGGSFTFMRPGSDPAFAVIGSEMTSLDPGTVEALESLMPQILIFSTDVAIPDSVPIGALAGQQLGRLADRHTRSEFLDAADAVVDPQEETLWAAAAATFRKLLNSAVPADISASKRTVAERKLAKKLLTDLAKVDPRIFTDLQTAINIGDEGDVSGLVGQINQSLAKHLNFTRWWSQDSDFQLRVSVRERELAFTIADRTGMEYSFGERSRGLTHFLAYFVQLRSHRPEAGRKNQMLLMDEPDAYLSNAGQQDLLRVLENFALPDDGSRSNQVVYVTHSPFLINKNAAHRIRVLDKGSQAEGTRVVKDVARTHYEPLRTSLGGDVAETAFIGGKNLIVEGVADQVLIAGMSNALRRRATSRGALLDLNEVTIVPAGSADSVPYIAYLARGRDPIKPPCVALVDGDEDGLRAAAKLKKSEANRKPVLDTRFIVNVTGWAASRGIGDDLAKGSAALVNGRQAVEIEDLIPASVAIQASRAYLRTLLGLTEAQVAQLTDNGLKSKLDASEQPLWDELTAYVTETVGEKLDKVGFAREVVAYFEKIGEGTRKPAGIPALEENFSSLIAHVAELLDDAAIHEADRRRRKRVKRVIGNFLDDFQDGSTRTVADSRLREIEASLDDSVAHDQLRLTIAALRRDFKLRVDPTTPVPNFPQFRLKLEDLHLLERVQEPDDD